MGTFERQQDTKDRDKAKKGFYKPKKLPAIFSDFEVTRRKKYSGKRAKKGFMKLMSFF